MVYRYVSRVIYPTYITVYHTDYGERYFHYVERGWQWDYYQDPYGVKNPKTVYTEGRDLAKEKDSKNNIGAITFDPFKI